MRKISITLIIAVIAVAAVAYTTPAFSLDSSGATAAKLSSCPSAKTDCQACKDCENDNCCKDGKCECKSDECKCPCKDSGECPKAKKGCPSKGGCRSKK